MSYTKRRAGGRSPSPVTMLIVGFLAGAGLILFLLYLPQQHLLLEREQAINDMARFNREEQERVRAIRDISTGEMMKWVGLTERTNAQFEQIQLHLADQERKLQNPGWFYITLLTICLSVVTVIYIWINRLNDVKDAATLENFEVFIRSRMQMLEEKQADRQLPGRQQ